MGLLVSDTVASIFFLISGLLLYPPTYNILYQRLPIKIERVARYILVVIFYVFGGLLFGKNSEMIKEKTVVPNAQESAADQTTNSIHVTTGGVVNETTTQLSKADREERIEKLFSGWDGSNRALVRAVKENLNDPDSFKHERTEYWDRGDYIQVAMKYRAKNVYGAMIIGIVSAKIDLDGNVISINQQIKVTLISCFRTQFK